MTKKSWFNKLSAALTKEPQTRNDLIHLLRDAQRRELLNNEVLAMLEGVLQVAEMQVRDIMVPRSQMIVIKENANVEEVLPVIIESGHSRFPVIGATRDEVKGLLLAKDLLKSYFAKDHEYFDIHTILRPASFVPEGKRLDSLLKDFRRTHNHLAIVADEYGGIAGLITIEDVLEQIVGDIEDEFDPDKETCFIHKLTENRYQINALTPIEDFNEHFSCQLSSAQFDTIGGLVLNQLGHLPKRGEQARIKDFQFIVTQADNRRIQQLEMSIQACRE